MIDGDELHKIAPKKTSDTLSEDLNISLINLLPSGRLSGLIGTTSCISIFLVLDLLGAYFLAGVPLAHSAQKLSGAFLL